MLKQSVKAFAKKSGLLVLYNKVRIWYDNTFCDRFECGIGDIILLRNVPLHNQILLTSRLMDVEDYLSGKNLTFPRQNTISRAAYGDKHREEDGNRSFRSLIESYMKDGYHSDSYITCDSDMNLMDGNHRMGLHILSGIESVNVKRLHRKVGFQYGGDWYYEEGLPVPFMEEIFVRFEEIQSWLVESGNTFCMFIKGFDDVLDEAASIIGRLCKLVRVRRIEGGIFQFSMPSPDYKVKNGTLISTRAQTIKRILQRRINAETIIVSNNCLEGKRLFEVYYKTSENNR